MSTWTTSVRLRPLWTRVGVLMLGVSMALAGSASAQPTRRAAGPFSGLFGGGGRVDNVHAVNARGSLFGIWQNIVIPEAVDRTLLDPLFEEDSAFTGASGSMSYTYARRARGGGFFFDGTGNIAEYSISADQPQYFFSTAAGVNTNLTRRITFNSTAGLGYSPYLGFLQGAPNPSDLASMNAPLVATSTIPASNYSGNLNASLSYGLSRHSSLSVETGWNAVFVMDYPEAGTRSWTSRILYNHSLTSKINVHAGYFRGQLGVVGGNKTITQGIDFGVDYGDALRFQLARRTSLRLSPSLSFAVSPIDGGTHVAGTGTVNLEHSFFRTWSSTLSYQRTLGVSPGFQDLVLSDTVSASVNGQLSHSASWVTMGSWATGQVGFGDSSASSYGALSSTTFSSILTQGLGRRIGVFAQYSYFKSKVPAGISTLPFLPDFARQTALVGFQFFAPLYNSQRARR